MSTSFPSDLALKVLSGEASSEERQVLRRELDGNSEALTEFEDLKGAYGLLRGSMPLVESLEASEPVLPQYALESLHTARRQIFRQQLQQPPSTGRTLATYLAEHSTFFLRIIFASGALAVLLISMAVSTYSDATVEVGMYREDSVRGGGGQPLVNTNGDINGMAPPSAHARAVKVQIFDLDQPFDQWKTRLAWYQHGKVWIDNEKNLVHILSRDSLGEPMEKTEPLAATDAEQHQQVLKAVESLRR